MGWAVYIMWGRENSSYTELLVLVPKGMGWGWFPCHPDHETAEYICLSETLVKLREAKAHQTWAQAGAWVCAVWTSDRSGATHPQYLWWELGSCRAHSVVGTEMRCTPRRGVSTQPTVGQGRETWPAGTVLPHAPSSGGDSSHQIRNRCQRAATLEPFWNTAEHK